MSIDPTILLSSHQWGRVLLQSFQSFTQAPCSPNLRLGGAPSSPHFTDEESEAQGGKLLGHIRLLL